VSTIAGEFQAAQAGQAGHVGQVGHAGQQTGQGFAIFLKKRKENES
jgi:hypothetical protein